MANIRKRKKSVSQLRMEGARKVLCILEDETPLTVVEGNAVIDCISDEHIALLARGDSKDNQGRCITGYYV